MKDVFKFKGKSKIFSNTFTDLINSQFNLILEVERTKIESFMFLDDT